MGLKDKLKRLQRLADEETVLLRCEECGEEICVAQETDLDLLAYEWVQATGEKSYRPTPPDVYKVLEHVHGALVEKSSGKPWPLMDLGGGRVGFTR